MLAVGASRRRAAPGDLERGRIPIGDIFRQASGERTISKLEAGVAEINLRSVSPIAIPARHWHSPNVDLRKNWHCMEKQWR